MIKSQDGEERAARILMPNKNVLQRSIVHLYPLECHEDERKHEEQNENINEQPNEENECMQNKKDDETSNIQRRPRRKAAEEARDRIIGQTLPEH